MLTTILRISPKPIPSYAVLHVLQLDVRLFKLLCPISFSSPRNKKSLFAVRPSYANVGSCLHIPFFCGLGEPASPGHKHSRVMT